MVMIKKKTTTKLATSAVSSKAALQKKKAEIEPEIEEKREEEEQEEASVAVLKKPAASVKKVKADEEEETKENEEENDDDDMEEDEEEEVDPQAIEAEIVTKRTKELKSLYADELKELASKYGIAHSNKDTTIKSIVAHEAKGREKLREKEASIRAVVLKKKEELEAKPAPELKKMCEDIGIKGVLSKQVRLERLLAKWQEEDGIDKALAQIAHENLKEQLLAKDTVELKKLCEKLGVDPLVHEIMVDRIIKQENETGHFSPPVTKSEDTEKESKPTKTADLVTALIANEAERKKEKMVKQKQEEVAAAKIKELRANSVEDLKKLAAKKGMEVTGKKEDMVNALFARFLEEEAEVAKKTQLKSMALPELKELIASKGLETSSKKDAMIDALLAHDAKCRDDARAHSVKVSKMSEKLREDFEAQTNNELKELCISKGLKPGIAKEDRVQRLIEDAQKDGTIDKKISAAARTERRATLSAMDKEALLLVCEKIGIDPFVKVVIVERILSHERCSASLLAEEESDTRPAKKARKQ